MTDRLRPVLSIQTVLLLALIALGGLAAESFAPSDIDVRLWTIALAAGLLGVVLGLLRTPDSVAHLTAIASGVGLAVVMVALRTPTHVPDASYVDRVKDVSTAIRDWYLGVGDYEDTETMLIVVLLQVITWLISYLTAWSLMRHGWITPAVLLPGGVVAGAQVTMEDIPAHLLEVTVVVAIVLLARMTYLRRRGGRESGGGVGSLVTATIVALLVLSVGLSTPEDFSANTVEPAARYATDVAFDAQEDFSDWVSDTFGISGSQPPDPNDYPRYTAFDDAFSIGGDLQLSDQPEVMVRTAGDAPYLAAQSYDRYTGRGWESTVEEGFEAEGPDGVRYSPELTFRPGQSLPYSGAVNGERAPREMEVTPLTPDAERLYSTGMFLNSSDSASVRMSWRQLDNEVFALREMDLSTLPPDLTGVASVLLRADALSVEGDAGLLYPDDPSARDQLASIRDQLDRRFVDVRWTVAGDGRVETLVASGQLPVYDDTVAVKPTGDGVEGAYQVTSLQTTVTEEQLRTAPANYPAWATDRYLDLPETVTDRTIDLAAEVTSGIGNPYERAKAVERFLRDYIAYDLEVGVPSEDWDIVDYLLFENQRGYCEHYATSMTVMLRSLGIPARTVVGYHPGDWSDEAGGYIYRQQQAHAWTEAFFPGYGWIRFEPTAAQPESSLDADTAPDVPPELPTPTPELEIVAPQPPEAATPAATEEPAAPIADVTRPTPEDGGDGAEWPLLIGTGVLALTALGVGAWWLLTRAPALDPRALFGAMLRWGRIGGVRGEPAETPREYARQLGYRYPGLARDAYDIVEVYEDQEYGGRAPERSRLERAGDAFREMQREVIRRFVRIRR